MFPLTMSYLIWARHGCLLLPPIVYCGMNKLLSFHKAQDTHSFKMYLPISAFVLAPVNRGEEIQDIHVLNKEWIRCQLTMVSIKEAMSGTGRIKHQKEIWL